MEPDSFFCRLDGLDGCSSGSGSSLFVKRILGSVAHPARCPRLRCNRQLTLVGFAICSKERGQREFTERKYAQVTTSNKAIVHPVTRRHHGSALRSSGLHACAPSEKKIKGPTWDTRLEIGTHGIYLSPSTRNTSSSLFASTGRSVSRVRIPPESNLYP